MQRQTRRTFLRQAGATMGAAATLAWGAPVLAAGTGKRVVVAVIGCARGVAVGKELVPHDATVAYVCDPDRRRAEAAGRTLSATHVVADMRRAFDDPAVDAVVIATPDHWHAPATRNTSPVTAPSCGSTTTSSFPTRCTSRSSIQAARVAGDCWSTSSESGRRTCRRDWKTATCFTAARGCSCWARSRAGSCLGRATSWSASKPASMTLPRMRPTSSKPSAREQRFTGISKSATVRLP